MLKSLPLLFLASACFAQMSPPGHFAFYRDEVHEIRLRFSQSNYWETLTKNYEDNEDVPYLEASLTWGPFSFAKVGVRFKGNSSYNGATTKKKPFRIKLNEFVKGQKIMGMASFNLSNGWNDPSLLREKVYNDLATDAGIVGPRANMAALYIND
jgi:spore coat protein CotH